MYIKAVYIYASERSRCTLSENGFVYYAMTYCFGYIKVWSWRILLNFCWVSIFFDILITNISWTVAQTPINQYVSQTPINHIIFWKSVMRTFRYIYVNCFNRLRFLAEVNTDCKKDNFLDNLSTKTWQGNMETRAMTPFFSSTFSALTVFNIHFLYLKLVKIYFHVAPFCFILVSKIPQFWTKTTNSDSPLCFSRKGHPEVIHVMLCPPRGAKKGISSWTSNVKNLIHDFGSKLPETLNISISNFCKLRSWTFKEASFARSSSKVELWSWHTILKSFLWIRFIWPIIFHCETSKQLEHKKMEMLQKQ